MPVIEYTDWIRTIQKRNAQLSAAYLTFFIHGGYQPTPPNPNVVGFSRLRTEFLLDDQDEDDFVELNRLGATFAIFPATVVVPNVVGMSASSALTALANVSLFGTLANIDADQSVPYQAVVTQSVPALSHVGQGTVVNLQIQDLTLVPSVVGLSQSAAQAALIAASLAFTVQTKISIPPLGVVLTQSIAVGTQEPPNTVVVITISVNGDGFRVQAVTAGMYLGTYYNPGDVFDLIQAADFSDVTLNYEIEGGEYNAGWMLRVTPGTPITLDDGIATFPAVDPKRRFVE